MSIEDYIRTVLDKIANAKNLEGDFAVIKNWEQGPLNIQRCHVISVYYIAKEKTILVQRVRICSTEQNDEAMYQEVYAELMANFILNWDEIWNLINTKLQ